MVEQSKWADMMLDMTRQAMKTGVQSMDNIQRQTEKVIDLSMNNMAVMQEESKKNYESWLDTAKKTRSTVLGAVEEGLNTFERQFSSKKEPIKTK